ncbi:DUF3617 domain-containing protein [Ramlibacter sp. PS3R-8]|uniref:DUF3617 domain-containing protein n=1 Tax=Ramlibacter sp. PS3R-8 TaxID=3133437 RepID=UPI00309DC058
MPRIHMETSMRTCLLAATAALSIVAFPAGAQSLKPGLWEINNKMGGGQMDQAMADMQKQMAQMSPAERKQMEEMMGKQGVRMAPAAGGGMTVQMCMTKEMVERNDMPMQDGCRMTQNTRSGNTMKMAFTCTNPPSSGEGQVTFASPEAYTSKMTMRMQEKGKTETMTMDTSGKWLKADCGNVKPVTPPKK